MGESGPLCRAVVGIEAVGQRVGRPHEDGGLVRTEGVHTPGLTDTTDTQVSQDKLPGPLGHW